MVNDSEAIGTSNMLGKKLVKLLYIVTNNYNAHIYQDRDSQHYYLAGDTNLEFLPEVLVKWEGDRWVDDQGTNFFRTQHPAEVNPFGELQGALIEPEPEERPPSINEAEFRTTSHVVKVDVDQEEVGLYKFFDPRTSTAYYYECVDPRPNELTRKKILYLYVLENRP